MADKTERPLRQTVEFRGRVLTLNRDIVLTPDGREAEREIVHHRGAVAIAALTDRNEILLVRQYRYAIGQETLEIPAGKLETGEEPQEAALRELREETGARAGELYSLGFLYPTCAYSDEKIYLYLARSLTFGPMQPDEDEHIDPLSLPLGEAIRLCQTGEITDAKTFCALLLAEHFTGGKNLL